MSDPYVLAAKAQGDLQAITARLFAEAGEPLARQVALALRRRFRYLAAVPWMGHRRLEITRDESVRFFPVYSYLIVYLPVSRPLSILRILHGAREPGELRSELQERGPVTPDDPGS